MKISSRSKSVDENELLVQKALELYLEHHPHAEIVTFRQNPVSIHIRIVDPSFQGMDRVARQESLSSAIVAIPDEVQGDITRLLLLTPEEAKVSFANFEFEHPIPSP